MNYICPSGGSVVLQANTGTGFSHQWYKNSVAISGATLPSYTATTTGSYTVKIVNQQGCPDLSDPVYLINSSSPSAFINSPSTNVTVCPNSVIGLAANAGSGYSYQWFRNGTALNGATTQIISVTDSGSYTVRVTNSSGCFATSAIRKISWYALPSATISTPGNFGFCQGSSVTLSVPSVAGNTYKWYKYGNLISGAKQGQSNPDQHLANIAMESVFKGRSYSKIPEGTPESLEKLTLADLKAHYAKAVVKSRIYFVVVGNVNPDDVIARVKAAFSKMPMGSPAPVESLVQITKPGVYIEDRDIATNYLMGIMTAPSIDRKSVV